MDHEFIGHKKTDRWVRDLNEIQLNPEERGVMRNWRYEGYPGKIKLINLWIKHRGGGIAPSRSREDVPSKFYK